MNCTTCGGNEVVTTCNKCAGEIMNNNYIAGKNKAREEQAKEILEKITELFDELKFHDRTEDFYFQIRDYINEDLLFKGKR